MLELADKDFKRTSMTMFSDVKESMLTINEQTENPNKETEAVKWSDGTSDSLRVLVLWFFRLKTEESALSSPVPHHLLVIILLKYFWNSPLLSIFPPHHYLIKAPLYHT
jgi:hypothetical protein